MSVSITSFNSFLKDFYVKLGKIYDLGMMEKPLLGLVPKDASATGKQFVQPVAVNNIVGDSAHPYSASLNATTGLDVNFAGPWKKRYHHIYLDDEVIVLSDSREGAFKKVTDKVKSAMEAYKQSIEIQLYRTETGEIARLDGSLTGSTTNNYPGNLTLSDATSNMAQFLEPSHPLEFNAATTATTYTANRTVSTINKQGGTFTITAGTGGGLVGTSDYIWKAGDMSASLAGVNSWIPDSAPSDTFKNVDRSVDPTSLGGLRLAGSGLQIRDAIVRSVSLSRQYGADPDCVIIHDTKFRDLVEELGSQVQYVETPGSSFTKKGGEAGFGFSGLVVNCGSGRPVKVYSSPFCQKERGWVLELASWTLYSAGGTIPHIRNFDGQNFFRLNPTSTNQKQVAYDCELISYFEMVCGAPKHNVNIKFDQSS